MSTGAAGEPMVVDVWSDVICPWCYVGKRRFALAVEQFEAAEVVVRWRSYELQPGAPREREGDMATHIARKYGLTIDQAVAANDRLTRVGAEVGLELNFDRARPGNTFDAHRLIWLAGAAEPSLADAVGERFMHAYFTEGAPIGDPATLAALAVEAGLAEGDVAALLEGDRYAAEVRADEEAALDIGIGGVPFFLIDGRFAVPGAEEPDVMVDALQRAWAKQESAGAQAGR